MSLTTTAGTGEARRRFDDLEALRQTAHETAATFQQTHKDAIERYRTLLSGGIKDSLERLRGDVAVLTGGDALSERIVAQATAYVDWLQWTLGDLPYAAAALTPAPETFRTAVAACGIACLATHIFDDAAARTFMAKGDRPTLLATAGQEASTSEGAEGLTVLAGLLLLLDALTSLSEASGRGEGTPSASLAPLLSSLRRSVLGSILAYSADDARDPSFYDRYSALKSTDYAHALLAALDPTGESPLVAFLGGYYAVARGVDDVQDYPEAARAGKPNLLQFYIPTDEGARSVHVEADVPDAVVEKLRDQFLHLGATAEGLSGVARDVALFKLDEALSAAYGLGLFAPLPPAEAAPPPSVTGLYWVSGIEDVLEHVGPSALEHPGCRICGSFERSFLFKKQGFPYHRCLHCSHIYTSPRISAAVQTQIGVDLDDVDMEDTFLEIQKIYAASILHHIRARAVGARLLDIGYGRGYLMQLAQAYGFEVYGVDSSTALAEHIRPQFGQHLFQAVMGRDDLPWGQFDVVVMSHIVEHLPDPVATIGQVVDAMNPGGILYLAVPDIESMQFRIFGKKWDVINPIAHFQYFNERSLARLLRTCGMQDLQRVRQPAIPDALAPRWMHLVRRLGGTDSGELAIISQKPLTGA